MDEFAQLAIKASKWDMFVHHLLTIDALTDDKEKKYELTLEFVKEVTK